MAEIKKTAKTGNEASFDGCILYFAYFQIGCKIEFNNL